MSIFDKPTSANGAIKPSPEPRSEGFGLAGQVAAGMLNQDLGLLPLLLILVCLPSLVINNLAEFPAQSPIQLRILEHALEIILLYFVGYKWVRQLAGKARTPILNSLAKTLAFGFALWFLLTLPFAAQLTGISSELKAFFFALLVPAIYLNLRYFFYCIPYVLGVSASPARATAIAWNFTRADWTLGIKTILAPLGISALLSAICAGFSPNESSLLIENVKLLVEGLLPLLSAYLLVAVALVQLPEPLWHEAGLDPYRQARLSTLAINGPAWISKLLQPKKGLILLILGALVWSANLFRLADMPPNATVSVKSVELRDQEVLLRVTVQDSKHHLRGFRPIFFALASKNRSALAPWPESVSSGATNRDLKAGLDLSDQAVDLELKFSSERSAADLAKLEDIYLWYANYQISQLSMKSAKIIAAPQTAPPSATP